MAKKFAWSFSALQGFELCPKKHYSENIAKDVRQKENPTQQYGITSHKEFEKRLLKGTPLPLDLRHHEKFLKRIYDRPGQAYPEQKLALTKNFELTGFFDSDVWVRTIIDYAKVEGNKALVLDHKFGKQKEGTDQLDLMAAVLFAAMPELEYIVAAYYWAKTKEFVSVIYTRADIAEIWNNFMPRVDALEDAIKMTNFPPTKGFLCKNYCPVTSCPFNG